MMNFEMFKIKTKEALEKRYPDAVITISRIEREGVKPYTGLSVKRPSVNGEFILDLEGYYMKYRMSGDFTKVVNDMAVQTSGEGTDILFDGAPAYERIRGRLFAQLRYLDEVPDDALCYEIGDFGMLFFILVHKYDGGQQCARISQQVLDVFHVSQEQVMRDALKNSETLMPPLVTPVDTYVRDEMELREGGSTMIVVTNKEESRGAVVLFYEGVMERIAAYLQDDLYIIPSSIHEMLVLPASEFEGNEENLEELIHDLNHTHLVGIGEKLSDHLYCYHRFTRIFEKAVREMEDEVMRS